MMPSNTMDFAVIGFVFWLVAVFFAKEKIYKYKQIIAALLLLIMLSCVYFFKELLPLASGFAGGAFLGHWFLDFFFKKTKPLKQEETPKKE